MKGLFYFGSALVLIGLAWHGLYYALLFSEYLLLVLLWLVRQ